MESKQDLPQKKSQLNSYVKYSGLGFQMIISLCLATWAGIKLDEHFEVKTHLFTIFLMLFAVIGSIYLLIRSLTGNGKN